MEISSIGKESINIVIEILNRRIKWIEENEPHAIYEIEESKRIIGFLNSLVDLEISK